MPKPQLALAYAGKPAQLWVDPRTSIYHIMISYKDFNLRTGKAKYKKKRISTGTNDLQVARTKGTEILKQWVENNSTGVMRISDIKTKWLDINESKKSTSYTKDLKNSFEIIEAFFENKPANLLTKFDIEELDIYLRNNKKHYRTKKPLSHNYVNSIHRHFKVVLKHAKKRDYITDDNLYSLVQIKEDKNKQITWFSIDQIEDLLNTMYNSKDAVERLYAHYIQLLFLTGFRPSEIHNMRFEHIKLNPSVIELPHTKTGSFIMRLRPDVYDIIEKIKTIHDNKEWVVAKTNRSVKNKHIGLDIFESDISHYFTKYGFPEHTSKSCRHSFVTNLLLTGKDILTVQKLARHKRITTTMHYVNIISDLHIPDTEVKYLSKKIDKFYNTIDLFQV